MTAMDRPTVRVGSTDVDASVAAWNAANYLTVSQICLRANRLLRKPPFAEHINSRLSAAGMPSPPLDLIYVQFDLLIRRRDCDVVL
jgi:xylulose-5-phosphate/fructose-6-phosphate phosphoketolase